MGKLNIVQILGIVTIATLGVALIPKLNLPPFRQWLPENKNALTHILLSLAIAAVGVALVLPPKISLREVSEGYRPKNGKPKKQAKKSKHAKNKNSLGKRLKDAGWSVITAEWCGFCTMQKKFFEDNPELELHLLVKDESEASPEEKQLSQGFPSWCCTSCGPGGKGRVEPGFNNSIEKIESFLQNN